MNSNPKTYSRTIIVEGQRFKASIIQIEEKVWKASGVFRDNSVAATGQSESSALFALERAATQKLRGGG